MRIEDLDRNRVRPGLEQRILEDLRWLGLDWDEGPDAGGENGPYGQWARLESYHAAFERLREAGRLYPCFCSRRDIASAASAPQQPGDELRYPGTCRALDGTEARRRVRAGVRHAWRFRVDPGEAPLEFDDLVHGRWVAPDGTPPGDFVVYRADAVPAYQLAVVVDDEAMGIDEVVRGDDLLPSTLRQLVLFHALGFEPPRFGHVPLLLGADGARLSKRHRGVTLAELREGGATAEQVVGTLAAALGLAANARPAQAADLIEGFRLERVAPRPEGIVLDRIATV